MMPLVLERYRSLTAASLGFLLVSAIPNVSIAAEIADWCKGIADGVFCEPLAEKPPSWCGTKEITLALADGTVNPWRQLTAANALNEASKCPNVKGFEHTDGQNNTQKSISDINSLAARGVDAIVLFPDAGPALLPAVRDAYQQGTVIVPYRASVGGEEGKDFTAFVRTDFKQDGIDWANWMAKALNGKGTVVYLGGPAGVSLSRARGEGIAEVLKNYPDIQIVGEQPFEVTNWDSAVSAKTLTALISKYPSIDGVFVDASYSVLTSGTFQRANKPFPKLAGEDVNAFGCTWADLHKDGAANNFEYSSTSAGTWMVRLAVRWAISEAAGGVMDESFIVKGPDGAEHEAAKAGEKVIKNFQLENSIANQTFCDPNLPDTASISTTLTADQVKAALRGGI